MRVRGAVEAQQRQVDLMNKLQVQDFLFSVADPDPGSDAFLTRGSGMDIFGFKILKLFDVDPEGF
jgi:hypothetical protein